MEGQMEGQSLHGAFYMEGWSSPEIVTTPTQPQHNFNLIQLSWVWHLGLTLPVFLDKKNFGFKSSSFWPKFFSSQNFFTQNILWPKIFMTQKIFHPKFF